MTPSNDRLSSGIAIDIDRAVVDPDYRRRILEQLRRDRLNAEAALRAGAPTPDDTAPTSRD
jgi:hypothetical protein